MSRISGGCERCRKKRVKCDEARPSCRRCKLRGEACSGYRDVATLAFRSENAKLARRFGSSSVSSEVCSTSENSRQVGFVARSQEELPDTVLPILSPSSLVAFEDQAVSSFLDKFVVSPCKNSSSSGFLEFLPSLFKEVNYDGRFALRWAVLAAGYASLSKDLEDERLSEIALLHYGKALSVLGKSLVVSQIEPDDHILMTIVILDLFEVSDLLILGSAKVIEVQTLHLPDPSITGAHAGGMAHMLRLRGPDQLQNPRGWSLFRLSHHRWQKQQMTYQQPRYGALPESDAWLESLNYTSYTVRAEKENSEIHSTCERARTLLEKIDNIDLPVAQILGLIAEIRDCDLASASWRQTPTWSFKVVGRSDIYYHHSDEPRASEYPPFVQLHHDVWTAYEWNYHRTGRIILHRHLLECLNRIRQSDLYNPAAFSIDVFLMQQASLDLVQTLVDEVLSTVPQLLGDIDNNGKILKDSIGAAVRKGIGAYFLLWPIKIIKSLDYAAKTQKNAAQAVFERIRECTGMKTALGAMSNV